MARHGDEWFFGDFIADALRDSARTWKWEWKDRYRGRRRRSQMFESGEVKYVILRLLREKPRHGYEIIKALEEKLAGCYTASAGTVYPTLQLLEDQGYVRAVETDGKKVYHVTPEGEKFLDEHRSVVEEIFDRVRDTVRDFAGGGMSELNRAFGRLGAIAYHDAWRVSADDPIIRRTVEILDRAADDIRKAQQGEAA